MRGPPEGKAQLARNLSIPSPKTPLRMVGSSVEVILPLRLRRGLGAVVEKLEVHVARRAGHFQAGDEQPLAVVGERNDELLEGDAVEGEVFASRGRPARRRGSLRAGRRARGRSWRAARCGKSRRPSALPSEPGKAGRERGEVHRRGELQLGRVVGEVPVAVGVEFAALERDLELVEVDHAVAERAVDGELARRGRCARSGSGRRWKSWRARRGGRAWSSRTRAGRRAAARRRCRRAPFAPSGRCPRAPATCCAGGRLARAGNPSLWMMPRTSRSRLRKRACGVLDADVVAVESDGGVHVVELDGLVRADGQAHLGVGDAGAVDDAASAPPAEPRDADADLIDLQHGVGARGVVVNGDVVGQQRAGGREQQAIDRHRDRAGCGAPEFRRAGRSLADSGRPKKRSQRMATSSGVARTIERAPADAAHDAAQALAIGGDHPRTIIASRTMAIFRLRRSTLSPFRRRLIPAAAVEQHEVVEELQQRADERRDVGEARRIERGVDRLRLRARAG